MANFVKFRITLNSHAYIRWPSKYNSIYSLRNQLPQFTKALHSIAEKTGGRKFTVDSVSSAKSIMKMIKFEFVCWLYGEAPITLIIFCKKNHVYRDRIKHFHGLLDFLNEFS